MFSDDLRLLALLLIVTKNPWLPIIKEQIGLKGVVCQETEP